MVIASSNIRDRLHPDALWLIVKRYAYKAGLDAKKIFTVPSLRATFATKQASNNVDVLEIHALGQ